MIGNLEDVILFAALAHGEQKMFEPDVPYITHLFGVTSNVLEAYYNGKEEFDLDYALKVAILHDVIEDTKTSYESILQRYGEDIANGVNALTKDDNLKKEEKMNDSIKRIKGCRKEVAIVKLADRTFNIRRPPSGWGKEKRINYLNEAKIIYDELGYSNLYLKNKLKERIEGYLK